MVIFTNHTKHGDIHQSSFTKHGDIHESSFTKHGDIHQSSFTKHGDIQQAPLLSMVIFTNHILSMVIFTKHHLLSINCQASFHRYHSPNIIQQTPIITYGVDASKSKTTVNYWSKSNYLIMKLKLMYEPK